MKNPTWFALLLLSASPLLAAPALASGWDGEDDAPPSYDLQTGGQRQAAQKGVSRRVITPELREKLLRQSAERERQAQLDEQVVRQADARQAAKTVASKKVPSKKTASAKLAPRPAGKKRSGRR